MQYTKCSRLWVVVGVMMIGAAAVGDGLCAELSPYSLPSQQRMSVEMRPWEQRGAPTQATENTYYQEFANKAQNLTQADRAKLESDFQRRRDEAIRSGKVEEAQHYSRLAQIVSAGSARTQ